MYIGKEIGKLCSSLSVFVIILSRSQRYNTAEFFSISGIHLPLNADSGKVEKKIQFIFYKNTYFSAVSNTAYAKPDYSSYSGLEKALLLFSFKHSC